jgi:CHAT domain-containing protein
MPISLREAQGLLGADTTLLEYHLGRERSFLWFVTASFAEVFTLPPRSIIEEDIFKLNGFISEGQFSDLEAKAIPVARRLSKILLGPVADRLGNRRLVVVSDGAIHYVPFSALPDPAGSFPGWQGIWPSPLLLRHEIVSLPSASVLEAIRSEISHRKPPSRALAVLAVPSFAPGDFPPLPHSEEEARRILNLVPREQALEAIGVKATRDLVMSGKLSQYRFIHFITHALNSLDFPELSSVILSQIDPAGRYRNGNLRFQDIRDLDLPADLVVLSACKTALGKEVQGEGLVGLAQAFMYAGAARVVVSLWNVNDESTPLLMDRFYRAILVDGHSPAAALRAAQLWMSKQPKWQSPYYWASFELQGEWQ